MSGFVAIVRDVTRHPLFHRKPEWLGAWVMIIAEANYRDTNHLKRGELRISQKGLEELLGWSRKKVRHFLDELCSNGMITRDNEGAKKGQIGAKLSICNYAKYQDVETARGQIGAIEGPHTETKNQEPIEKTTTQQPVKGRSLPMAKQLDLPTDMDPELERVRKAWNGYAKEIDGKAEVRMLTPGRRRAMRDVMDAAGYTVDDVIEAIGTAGKSEYLAGVNWFTFDWMFKADANISKVLEGNYGNGRHAEPDFMHGMSVKEYQQFVLNGGR